MTTHAHRCPCRRKGITESVPDSLSPGTSSLTSPQYCMRPGSSDTTPALSRLVSIYTHMRAQKPRRSGASSRSPRPFSGSVSSLLSSLISLLRLICAPQPLALISGLPLQATHSFGYLFLSLPHVHTHTCALPPRETVSPKSKTRPGRFTTAPLVQLFWRCASAV
jgi:hypothetical protein